MTKGFSGTPLSARDGHAGPGDLLQRLPVDAVLRHNRPHTGPLAAACYSPVLVQQHHLGMSMTPQSTRDHSNRAFSGRVMRFNKGIAANTTGADRANPPSMVM